MKNDGGVEWPIRFSTTPDQELQNALYFLWSAGGQITNDDNSAWTFDTPEAIEGYTYYDKLFIDGLADPNPEAGAGAAESAFIAGDLGMLVAGSGEFTSLSEAGGEGFADKIGVAPFPKGPVSATAFVGGSNLVVFNESEQAAAAWKFIEYMSDPATQVLWYQTAGGLPSAESAWDDPALADDDVLAVFASQLGDTNSPPPVATWLQVADVMGQQVEQMIKQGKSPEQMLADTQAAAEGIGI